MPPHLWIDPGQPLLDDRCPLPLDVPFTGAEARSRGVSRDQLRRLVQEGYVRALVHGVYAAAQVPDNLLVRANALGLVVPNGAVITDRTAAWLHGVDILPRTALAEPPRVQVFRREGTRLRRREAQSGTRNMLDRDVTEVQGLAVTTPLRTALDLARGLWRFDALAAVDGFLRQGVDHEEMLAELVRFKGFRGIVRARWVIPLGDGRAESPGESALRVHWYDAGLPRSELQVWVYDDGRPLYRYDLALPELRYAAEYDGEQHHSSPQDVAYDEQRRRWTREHRNWTIDVFDKQDVYAPHGDPVPRLQAGAARARRGVSPWTCDRPW